MKWFMLVFLRGISVAGPFDTKEECLKTQEPFVMDQGFDHAIPSGWCFQAAPAPWNKKTD